MRKWVVFLSLASAALAAVAAAETMSITIPDSWLRGQQQEKEQPLLINVTGTGNVKTTPDQVVITATIFTQDKKASKAFEDNQAKMRALMDALGPLNIPREKVATAALAINPVYKENSSKVDYFTVNRNLVITQDDMSKISPVLDALVDAGVGDIGAIQFQVKDLEKKRSDALEAAAADVALPPTSSRRRWGPAS